MEQRQVGRGARADQADARRHHRACQEETEHGDKHIEVGFINKYYKYGQKKYKKIDKVRKFVIFPIIVI